MTVDFFTYLHGDLVNISNFLNFFSMVICEWYPELQSSMYIFIMVKYILGTSYQANPDPDLTN